MNNIANRIHNEILNVSYSKLFDIDIPWNSAEVFECACKLDFDGIKGDVTPTKDGKLVMCHDAEFWFDENGRVYEPGNTGVYEKKICEMTYEECKQLEYATEAAKNHLGYYAKVAGLEDMISICHKYSKFPYITVRDTEIDMCVDEVYELLSKYNLTDKCIINSFSLDTLKAMRKKDENIYLSQVQDLNITLTKAMIDDAVELKNCMICAFWSVKDKQMFDDMYEKSAEAIEYAKEKGVILYLAHGADKESYKTGLERGFKGFQCTVSDAFLD